MTRRSWLPALALSALLVIGLLTTGQPAWSAGSQVYIALGDSIAAGIGSSLPRERGYPAIVRGLLARQAGVDVTLESLAVPGETVGLFRDGGQLDRYRDLVDRLSRGGTPIAAVSLSLGGNEMLRVSGSDTGDRQAALDDFQLAYPAALADVRAAVGPDVPIVVTNYYDLSSGDPAIVESAAWWVARFNEVISAGAAASNAQVADVATAFAGRIDELTLNPSDVHPTNAGHQVIARSVWKALALDTTAPTIDVATALDATRLTPTLRFAVYDDTGVDSVRIESGGATVSGPYRTGDDEYVALVDLRGNVGSVTVTIHAADAAGNITSSDVTVNAPDRTR